MNEINNKCRTCFNKSCRGLQSLTTNISKEGNQQKSLADILNEVARINVNDDKCLRLPQAICSYCSRKLKAARAYIKQAQKVNEKLCSLFLQHSDEPLVSLQEIQTDYAEFKLESENSRFRDVTIESAFLKRGIEVKQEDQKEDTLAAAVIKNKADSEDGKYGEDFLGVTYPDISIVTEMYDNEDNKFTYSSLSDDSDCQNKSNSSRIKSVKKDTKSIKTSKLTKDATNKDNKNNNEDEKLYVKGNDCNKIFDSDRVLTQHVSEDLKIQCLHCEAKFNRRHNMYAHIRRTHKTENLEELQIQLKKPKAEKKFPCLQCSRSYTNKYKLMTHVNIHHNPESRINSPKVKILQPKKRFLCALCGLKFENIGNLNIHFRRHTGEKPFKCEYCDRAYPRLYDVKVHRRMHTGEKPYQCTLCESTFRNSKALKVHMRIHTNERPYQCTLCEKTFRHSKALKVHMRTHTNERPYKCTECEKAFKQSKDLNIHKRIHTGERPYKCVVCHSTFTQSNSLRLHQIKQQHFEKPKMTDNCSEGIAPQSITSFPLIQST